MWVREWLEMLVGCGLEGGLKSVRDWAEKVVTSGLEIWVRCGLKGG